MTKGPRDCATFRHQLRPFGSSWVSETPRVGDGSQQPHNAVPLLPVLCFSRPPTTRVCTCVGALSLVRSYGLSTIDHGLSASIRIRLELTLRFNTNRSANIMSLLSSLLTPCCVSSLVAFQRTCQFSKCLFPTSPMYDQGDTCTLYSHGSVTPGRSPLN